MRIGIIGYGDFGQIMAKHLSEHAEVAVASRKRLALPIRVRQLSITEIATYDYVILAIPLTAYQAVLTELAPHLRESSIIVDVCSVKLHPQQLLKQHAPNAKRLLTHPLFGPQSAADSLAGHQVVVCPESGQPGNDAFLRLLKQLGLNLSVMTPDEHDRLMAKIHALTFFVGRALTNSGIGELPIVTPSYKKLLALSELDKSQTEDLFQTIEHGNPHATAIRQSFLRAAEDLHRQLID